MDKFENFGYFKEYFQGTKFLGMEVNVEKDRETFGYWGRKTEVLDHDVTLHNGKVIKTGTEITTMLQQLSGKSAYHLNKK